MAYFTKIQVESADSPSIDAFGRQRFSEPETIFDSKQIHDSQVQFWDDQETSGSGTSSAHQTNKAATAISVGATTAGTRVRQTFEAFNYQPGKSQLILQTFAEFDTSTGITKRVGIFNDNNGLFFESEEGTLSVVTRTYTSGSAVDNSVAQSSWNLDKLDGSGPSGYTLDLTKSQISIIDYEWLGVGRVRMGFVIDGMIIYCHEFLNANNLDLVYMSTPNLPLRYEISNDGTGVADDFIHICSTVISEGGRQDTGVTQTASTGGTHVDANAADTIYAVLGVRLKSTYLDMGVRLRAMSMIAETADDFEWMIYLNPTVAGIFTYADNTNSYVQTAKGATANTITGGFAIAGGFSRAQSSQVNLLNTVRNLGAAIDGTPDEMVLCVRPLSANADIQATLSWLELT